MFDVGDKVVYPHHGAGTIEKKEVKVVLGEEREYLTIRILHNEMTVNVPVDNAEKCGLRWVIDQEMVDVVVKVLLRLRLRPLARLLKHDSPYDPY